MLRAHCFALCWALATVSRIAGHATVAFTLQVYFHPSEDTAAPLAASVEATLGSALSAL